MKRLALSIFILSIIVAGSIISLCVFRQKNTELIEMISSAEKYMRDNNITAAENEVAQIESLWSDYYSFTSYILQNTRLDEISSSVSKLRGLIKSDEFYSECDSIIYSVNIMYEKEFPHLGSVL